MNPENHELQFQLGQMNGQIMALNNQVSGLSTNVVALDQRLRTNEIDVGKIITKIGFIGIASGGLGTGLMKMIEHFLK